MGFALRLSLASSINTNKIGERVGKSSVFSEKLNYFPRKNLSKSLRFKNKSIIFSGLDKEKRGRIYQNLSKVIRIYQKNFIENP